METETEDMSGEELFRAFGLNNCFGYLSLDEIATAVKIVTLKHEGLDLQFTEVNYYSPPKHMMARSVRTGVVLPRQAEVISMCISLNQSFIDIVPVSPQAAALVPENPTKVLTNVQTGVSPRYVGGH